MANMTKTGDEVDRDASVPFDEDQAEVVQESPKMEKDAENGEQEGGRPEKSQHMDGADEVGKQRIQSHKPSRAKEEL